MVDEIQQPEHQLENSESQIDGAQEAERRIREAQDLPRYQQLGDGSYQRQFSDRQGRDMTLRVDGNDAQTTARVANESHLTSQQGVRIRVADTAEAATPPTFRDKGQIGFANASLEINRDVDGNITDRRLRLQDIKTNETHEGNGVGGQMLDEVERVGRQHNVREIYGNFDPDSGNEAATRRWYQAHGFEFRPSSGVGRGEVYKTLADAPTDASALRHELRR